MSNPGISDAIGSQLNILDRLRFLSSTNIPVGTDVSNLQQSLNLQYDKLAGSNTQLGTVQFNQNEISKIVTDEKKRLDDKKVIIDQQLSSQERLLDLNDSYRKRQSEYIYIIFIIIIGLIIYLILVQIGKYFTIIPDFIIQLLIVLVASFVSIYIILLIMNINNRDRLNHDNILLSPPSVKTAEEIAKDQASAKDKGNLLKSIYDPNQCSGESCCSTNDIWNKYTNKCQVKCSTQGQSFFNDSCKPLTDCSGANKVCGNLCVPIATLCTESFSLNINKKNAEPFHPYEFSNYAKI